MQQRHDLLEGTVCVDRISADDLGVVYSERNRVPDGPFRHQRPGSTEPRIILGGVVLDGGPGRRGTQQILDLEK
jgi:hypothetical protein